VQRQIQASVNIRGDVSRRGGRKRPDYPTGTSGYRGDLRGNRVPNLASDPMPDNRTADGLAHGYPESRWSVLIGRVNDNAMDYHRWHDDLPSGAHCPTDLV